jgi:hypothetical protein
MIKQTESARIDVANHVMQRYWPTKGIFAIS